MTPCFNLRARSMGGLLALLLFGCASPSAITSEARQHAAVWKDHFTKGEAAWNKHELFAAANQFQAAAQEAEKFGLPESCLSTSLARLGRVREELGQDEQAEPVLRRCLELEERRLGSDSLEIVNSIIALADLCGLEKKYVEADSLLCRAQAILAGKFGAYDRTVGVCLLKRANLYYHQERWTEAEPLYMEALQDISSARIRLQFVPNERLVQRAAGPNPAEIGTALSDLGSLYRKEKKLEAADASLQKSLLWFEEAYGKKSPSLLPALVNLALVDMENRHYADAKVALQRCLRIITASDPNYPGRLRIEELLKEVGAALESPKTTTNARP